jgi:hypothetical protein
MVELQARRKNAVDTENDYGKPECFLVFLAGVNDRWQGGRTENVYLALYNEFLAAGVPPGQVVLVKGKKATKFNCEVELK